jgi:hypothetical protein
MITNVQVVRLFRFITDLSGGVDLRSWVHVGCSTDTPGGMFLRHLFHKAQSVGEEYGAFGGLPRPISRFPDFTLPDFTIPRFPMSGERRIVKTENRASARKPTRVCRVWRGTSSLRSSRPGGGGTTVSTAGN